MAIRDSQDVTLGIQSPVSNVRNSQDIILGVEKPSVTNIRNSQDILLSVLSIVAHVRNSQDVILAVYAPITATTLAVFQEISQPVQMHQRRQHEYFSFVPVTKKKFVQPQICVIS